MAFNTQELESITDSSLDFYFEKGKLFAQTIQQKPMLAMFERRAKSFPGGKGDISIGVKGDYGMPVNRSTGAQVQTPASVGSDTLAGYTHDDTVSFYTPANNRRVNYTWREHHLGITLTHTELKIDGISVSDTDGRNVRRHSQREKHVLANLLQEKLDDFAEQYSRQMDSLVHDDGSGDAKAMAGLQHLVTDNGAAGTKGGLDSSVVTWWRNRARTSAMATAISGDANLAYLGGGPVTSSPANGGALMQVLSQEYRQLRRYGGSPTAFFAGSDFIDALEIEYRANGMYSTTGFTKKVDAGVGQIHFKGVPIVYDPSLDDLSLEKRAYWFDPNDIFLMKMQGEWRRRHTPSRPHNQFVMYRSITCTGQMVARRLNSALVIDIA